VPSAGPAALQPVRVGFECSCRPTMTLGDKIHAFTPTFRWSEPIHAHAPGMRDADVLGGRKTAVFRRLGPWFRRAVGSSGAFSPARIAGRPILFVATWRVPAAVFNVLPPSRAPLVRNRKRHGNPLRCPSTLTYDLSGRLPEHRVEGRRRLLPRGDGLVSLAGDVWGPCRYTSAPAERWRSTSTLCRGNWRLGMENLALGREPRLLSQLH